MEPNDKTSHKIEVAVETELQTLKESKISVEKRSSQKIEAQNGKQPVKQKQQSEIIKQYERKMSLMSQTILRLTKKNEEQREQFRILNQKLNKAFSKLTPNKLKQTEKKNDEDSTRQQLEKVKKQLENEMKKNKLIKKQLQVMKETQNLLNNEEKFTQLKNQLADKQRQIKQLKEGLKGYERAEQNQKRTTHFKKQEQMSKKLHQLNEENIFLKKKVAELKAKVQQSEKQKLMERAEQAVQKNIKPKKATVNQQFVKKQEHQEQVNKLEGRIKIFQALKSSMQKNHKQELQSLKKQNQILSEENEELKMQIKKKNKEKFILQHRTLMGSQLKNSRLSKDKHNQTIDADDKNQRYKTLSLNLKNQSQVHGSLRKQFLGLSYGNFGNDYKKHDDASRLDETKNYTISSIKFKFFQQHILSLKVKYRYSMGEQVQIQTFEVDNSYTNPKTVELLFQQHEYIKSLDIFCGKMIEFIQLNTSRNQSLQVGNQKNQFKCKKYSFDIKNYQKPVAFGSITEVRKTSQVKKQCLVVLGLIMRKKDVSIGKKRILQAAKQESQKNPSTQRKHVVKQSQSKQKVNKSLQKMQQHQTLSNSKK